MTPGEQTGNDADLIDLARSGDDAAFAVLTTRHREAALRVANRRTRGLPNSADDVVAAAFERMRDTLRAGHGPVEAFRPYLLTLVCRLAHAADLDAALAANVGPIPLFAPGADHADPIVETESSRVFAEAFLGLPERWQALLWHRSVDGEDAAVTAALLGGSAEAVDALALCARRELRKTVLASHEARASNQDCPLAADLAPFVRGTLGRRALHRFEDHVPACASCRAALADLDDVEAAVAKLVAPLFLGAAEAVAVPPTALAAAAPVRRSTVLVGAGIATAAALVLGSGALAATAFLDAPADRRIATAAIDPGTGAPQSGPEAVSGSPADGAAGRPTDESATASGEPVAEEDRVSATTPDVTDGALTDPADASHRNGPGSDSAADREARVEAAGNRGNAPGRASDRPSPGTRPDGDRPGPAAVSPSSRPGIAPNPRPDGQQVRSSSPAAPPVAPRPTATYQPAPKPSPTPTRTYKPAPKPSPTPTQTYKPAPKPSPTPTKTYTPAPKPSPTPTKTYTPAPTPTPEPEEVCVIDLLGIKICL